MQVCACERDRRIIKRQRSAKDIKEEIGCKINLKYVRLKWVLTALIWEPSVTKVLLFYLGDCSCSPNVSVLKRLQTEWNNFNVAISLCIITMSNDLWSTGPLILDNFNSGCLIYKFSLTWNFTKLKERDSLNWTYFCMWTHWFEWCVSGVEK